MGKLRYIPDQVTKLPTRLGPALDAHGHSYISEPWRVWYNTARWRRLRWHVLKRDCFTCQMPDCRRLIGDSSKLVADHITPHRGDEAFFWDETNLQTLCQTCHSGRKQAEERRSRG